MYRSADPTQKISKRTHAEIREIHRTLPVMLRFLFLKAMSMDLDKDMLALPAEAKFIAPAPPRDGINVRIWENVS
jgi:hypothetical protein